MANFSSLNIGEIGLIMQTTEGKILQVGLTKEQSQMLQEFLAILSKESPLVLMDERYELILKSGK